MAGLVEIIFDFFCFIISTVESQYLGQHFTTQLALNFLYIYKKWVLIVMVGYPAVGGTFNHGLFL